MLMFGLASSTALTFFFFNHHKHWQQPPSPHHHSCSWPPPLTTLVDHQQQPWHKHHVTNQMRHPWHQQWLQPSPPHWLPTQQQTQWLKVAWAYVLENHVNKFDSDQPVSLGQRWLLWSSFLFTCPPQSGLATHGQGTL